MSKTLFPLLVLCLIIGGWIFIKSANSITPASLNAPLSQTSPQPTLFSTSTPTPSPVIKRSNVLIEVPFVAQAPTGNWKDARQQDGCEEAAAYMAMLWVKEEKPPADLHEQEEIIVELADWEESNFGTYHDTSAKDTVERIYKKFFQHENIEVSENVSIQSIKEALNNGKIVQVPADGRALKNPFFTAPGPERHNLLVIGYDDKTKEFITNDNGTRQGKSYRYNYDVLLKAIRDYPTGNHLTITENKKVMIVVSK